MVILTQDRIDHYRSALASDPNALRAVDLIEDCEGDLEDAAIVLALQAGQEPDRSERWLESLAKRWRAFLCQKRVKQELTAETVADVVRSLTAETTIPAVLAVPVVIYILETGVESFCKPFEERLF